MCHVLDIYAPNNNNQTSYLDNLFFGVIIQECTTTNK